MITFDHKGPTALELADAVRDEYFPAKEKLLSLNANLPKKELSKKTNALFESIVSQCLNYRPGETVENLMSIIKGVWKEKKKQRANTHLKKFGVDIPFPK